MSFATVLLAFAPGLAARTKPQREEADRAELIALRVENADLKRQLATVRADHDAQTRELEFVRRRRMAEDLRNRANAEREALYQQMALQAAAAQAAQGLQGAHYAQSLQFACNCVPARHDMLLRGG